MKKWGFRIIAVAFAVYAVVLAVDVNVSWAVRGFMAIGAIWLVCFVAAAEWFDRGGYKSTPHDPEDDDPGDEITRVVWRPLGKDDYRLDGSNHAGRPRDVRTRK